MRRRLMLPIVQVTFRDSIDRRFPPARQEISSGVPASRYSDLAKLRAAVVRPSILGSPFLFVIVPPKAYKIVLQVMLPSSVEVKANPHGMPVLSRTLCPPLCKLV